MGKKILVVDNHPVILKFMTQLFEKEGHQVMTAETGLDALDILRNFIPDIIFIDLVMPNIDGRKLCQIIRKIPKLKDIFLVILSAIAAEQKVDFTEFGANACIAKAPFNKMVKHIHTVMDQLSLTPSASLSDQVLGLSDVFPRHITEELLFIKRHFEAILGTMSEGILEITSEGRIVYANPAAIALIGILEETLLASNFTDLLKETDGQLIKDQLVAIHNQSKTIIRDFPVMINGKQILLNIFPIMDEKHRTIVIILNDVSERKRMEAQFLQAQKMEAIGQLAGGIAHDFNNLLTIIKGYSQLSLMELKEGAPLRENIEEINKASDRASDLTYQLLAFSRRQILEMRVLDLNALLPGVERMLRRVIGEDIELVTRLAEDLGRVKSDQGQIEQVIMNLAVNARDAMHAGGKLTIETANAELDEAYARAHVAVTPGRYVMLSVSDTGVGMTPEVRGRVFEPFFTTKERVKGTGLGLSTVYGIVKQSGGNIWVYSEPGKGTTFKIYLPRVDEPLEEVVERVVGGELHRGDETILVVEDNDEVREVAVRILSGQGYKVLEASQGLDAFLICTEHDGPIHLLLTDVVMPKMSGRELAERLGSIRPRIKVLYMSGYTGNAIVHHGVLEKGMNYIQKPFAVEALARKVREVLDK
jgi:PAS domain S-box-containing protein